MSVVKRLTYKFETTYNLEIVRRKKAKSKVKQQKILYVVNYYNLYTFIYQ